MASGWPAALPQHLVLKWLLEREGFCQVVAQDWKTEWQRAQAVLEAEWEAAAAAFRALPADDKCRAWYGCSEAALYGVSDSDEEPPPTPERRVWHRCQFCAYASTAKAFTDRHEESCRERPSD